MRDELTSRQLAATVLAGLSVPLTLLGARLHWRWVLVALLAGVLYYYIMYRLKRDTPLAEQAISVYGTAGKGVLWLLLAWLVWLAGYLTDKSVLAFPQTAQQPLTGLLLLALSAWAARNGIRAVVRCGTLLFLLLAVLYGIVLVFSAPQVQVRWLAPAGDWTQALRYFPLLTVPTLTLYFKPEQHNTKPALWLVGGGILALAASVITAGCLSPRIASGSMSFYTLARSVSLFGTMERFEALISAACLAGYFCLIGFVLCTAREVLAALLPQALLKKAWLLPFAAVTALVSTGPSALVFAIGAAIFCAVFPLLTQALGGRKKD